MTGFSALPVSSDAEAGAQMQWSGTSKVLGPKWLRMPILTLGMFGLQIIWSVEMSYAPPYLLSLGLSKPLMSIVFLAGPLSGLIVQPLIGVLSDGSHSRFGRRRPYIFFGTFLCFGAMYLLGFTRQFANVITRNGSAANDALTVGLAVLSIYCIDFSINAVQAMDRALLVDVLSVSEQEVGNAWAGRMFGLGSVFGFFIGNIDLTISFPFLGHTQLRILCVMTSCVLFFTHTVTVLNVRERVLMKCMDGTDVKKFNLWRAIKDIWVNFVQLPGTIKQICLIQLFAWVGWFPVLFWTSLYVGGLHKRQSPIPETDAAQAALEAEATRLGSRALLCNALASLFASVVCPFLVSHTENRREGYQVIEGQERRGLNLLKKRWHERPTCELAILWAISHGVFAICMLSTFLIANVTAATAVMTLSGFCWAITQWAPFALIADAIHCACPAPSSHYILGSADDGTDDEVESIPLRDTRTNRAPGERSFGNLDEGRRLILDADKEDEYEEEDEDRDRDDNTVPSKHVHFEGSELDSRSSKDLDTMPRSTSLGMDAGAHLSQDDILTGGTSNRVMHVGDATMEDSAGAIIGTPRHSRSACQQKIDDKAGIILGIHNVFIVIPQFIITGLSSIIFAVMDSGKSVLASHEAPAHLPGGLIGNGTSIHVLLIRASVLAPHIEDEAAVRSTNSVGVIFRIGGVSAAVACVLCLRLARELRRAQR